MAQGPAPAAQPTVADLNFDMTTTVDAAPEVTLGGAVTKWYDSDGLAAILQQLGVTSCAVAPLGSAVRLNSGIGFEAAGNMSTRRRVVGR